MVNALELCSAYFGSDRLQFKVVKVLSWELNEKECSPFYNCVRNLIHKEVEVVPLGDIKDGIAHVDRLIKDDPDLLYLAFAGTECNDTSMASQHMQTRMGTSRLHGPSSRTWFHWHAMVKHMVSKVSPQRFLHLNEYPQCTYDVDELLMNMQAGEPILTEAHLWGHCAFRNRRWRTSPVIAKAGSHIVPNFIKMPGVDLRRADDQGWWWQSNATQDTIDRDHPEVLRRYWPTLVEKASVPSERASMTKYEVQCLDSLRIGNGSKIKYFGPRQYLRHLGLEHTCLKSMLLSYPCFNHFSIHSGMACPASSVDSTECGIQMFCNNCVYLMKILGAAWHLPSASEVMTHVLILGIRSFLHGERVQWHGWAAPAHINCSKDCPLAPQAPMDHPHDLLPTRAPESLRLHVLEYHKRNCEHNWVL
jgi:hypothetical protein